MASSLPDGDPFMTASNFLCAFGLARLAVHLRSEQTDGDDAQSEPERACPIGDERSGMAAETEHLGQRANVRVVDETTSGLGPGQIAVSDDVPERRPPPSNGRHEDRRPGRQEHFESAIQNLLTSRGQAFRGSVVRRATSSGLSRWRG